MATSLRQLLKDLTTLQKEYNEKAEGLTSKQIAEEVVKFKAIRAQIQTAMTEGAKDCEGGHRPIGMFHDGTANPYEIGDPLTRKRVRAAFLEDAVEKWNKDEWLPPREEGTAVLTHKDATGKTISEKTVKVQQPKR